MQRKWIIAGIVSIIALITVIALFIILGNLPQDNLQEEDMNSNDFQMDLVLKDDTGDIHYHAFIPQGVNKGLPLFITLPGYEGLYFQGVGKNLEFEDFAGVAHRMNPNMIILAPQLSDWGETSANQTIALIEHYKHNYNISDIYINGYSGGGETLSLVLEKRADLFTKALSVSSQWDRKIDKIIAQKLPLYLYIGENDSYYGSTSFKETYNQIRKAYQDAGLSDAEIDKLIILDIKSDEYFKDKGINDSHGGGTYAAHESGVMNWLLNIDGFNRDTKVSDVINYTNFGDWGRLIFPVDREISAGATLETVGDVYIWYNYINPDRTVEVVNYLKNKADSGERVFYNIYSDAEKAKDSSLNNTGLFFFKGKSGAKTAILNAGGGFSYVGAMHDSFPHALELSKRGYNAFALIYRPNSALAMQDLNRALSFLSEHAKELEISMDNYSVWGGSAGARMAAWLGDNGSPKPVAVIMQYTGLSQVTGDEPPTYANVGTSDGIADYRTMQSRIDQIKQNGTDAEIEIFEGLPHGFGLGEGTVAEGWINHAIDFWERQIK